MENIEIIENNLTDNELNDITLNKETAAASYTLLFAPVLLITRRDSAFIKFHAAQGLVLGLLFLLLWWAGSYLSIFRYATIIVIFACVVGFLHALQGHKYSIPFISEIVKDGISPIQLFKGLKRAFGFIGKIFLGIFPKKVGDIIEKKTTPKPIKKLQERVDFLEEFFVLEKYFSSGKNISDISPEQKKYIEKILKNFSGKISEEDKKYIVTGKKGKIFLGNFSDTGFLLAGGKNIFSKEETKNFLFEFGGIKGQKINFDLVSKENQNSQ